MHENEPGRSVYHRARTRNEPRYIAYMNYASLLHTYHSIRPNFRLVSDAN